MKEFHWGMINPMTGAPFSFDDANVQWGEPGFYLEPGDPGFVPYSKQDAGSAAQPIDHGVIQPFGKIAREPKAGAAHSAGDMFSCDAAGSCLDEFSVSSRPDAESDDNTMDAAVAEITGIPAERCAEVLGAYLDQILSCAPDSQLAQGIHDLLTICSASGGHSSGKDEIPMFAKALMGAANARRHRSR